MFTMNWGSRFLRLFTNKGCAIALQQSGLKVERQTPIPVWFRGCKIADYKADILVENEVLVELKAARSIDAAFEKQLLNYLRATDIEVGLLFNFGRKPEFRRLVFENKRKIRVNPR
jgi:GxxExxY protein